MHIPVHTVLLNFSPRWPVGLISYLHTVVRFLLVRIVENQERFVGDYVALPHTFTSRSTVEVESFVPAVIDYAGRFQTLEALHRCRRC